MDQVITNTISLDKGTPILKKEEIKKYFEKTYSVDEKLFEVLADDDAFYMRADLLRHPLVFYLGHTAVFYMNKLVLAKIIDERINPHFESIFAIGVDEMSWDDLDENHYDWPSIGEVVEYRRKVKNLVLDVIDKMPLNLPVTWDNPFWIIMMGIEHERIHLETSSVLIRHLPLSKVRSGMFGDVCNIQGESPINNLQEVPAQNVKIGKPTGHRFYGWDNEYGNISENVETFEASQYLISNGEFLAFVEDGGYENQALWTDEGWSWRNYQKVKMPRFWRKNESRFMLRLMDREIPMPWNWPAEVNYLEAKAFANWKSARENKNFRLPTEAEWYALAQFSGLSDDNYHNKAANINLQQYTSPCPVDKNKIGAFYDVLGNVWQWTETPITGFPGFKVHPLYDDFSTPTFDGQHNLIKGGSWISTGNEYTWHARYAFRRHFYQHAGFRLVQSDNEPVIREDVYEKDREVVLSCDVNYGSSLKGYKNYPAKLAQMCIKHVEGMQNMKVLDLNCDTGRAAFELASFFDEVTALDSSARFIRMAIQMQDYGFVRYISKDENDLVFYNDLRLSELGIENRHNVKFMQADANNLKPMYTGYDLVLAANLLEELYNPISFLENIHERINTNGLLIVASSYDWETNNIKMEYRPGGFKRDGEPLSSFEGIKSLLNVNFKLKTTPEHLWLPIVKSSHKVELVKTEVSVWVKK